MVFSSLLFVFLFLTLNLVSQASLRGVRAKNIAMLIFSLVFFSWAGPRYVVLLLLDTALCWFFALQIEKQPGRKKLHLTLCVALVPALPSGLKMLAAEPGLSCTSRSVTLA